MSIEIGTLDVGKIYLGVGEINKIYLGSIEIFAIVLGWDISLAVYYGFIAVNAQDTVPSGLAFSSDGIYVYFCGDSGNDISQYTLSTAWDITTATFTRSQSLTVQTSQPSGVHFSPDGIYMYISGRDDYVDQFTLSTAWNISTEVYTRQFNMSGYETSLTDVHFSPDGIYMYTTGYTGDDVNQFTLSTAWNISTASYTRAFSIAGQETLPWGLYFSPDGIYMYIGGSGADKVHQYTLSTAWNISSTSYTRSFDVSDKETALSGINFKTDGTEMYIIGSSSDKIHQYNL